jgi:hypothetical protein
MKDDLVAEAKTIQSLKNEADKISARLSEVNRELHERVEAMNKRIMPDYQPKPAAHGRKKSPLKPRPVEDKLTIAAGKTIVAGLAAKWTPQQTFAQAVKSATTLARKYGLDTLPASVVEKITKKVQLRFNVANI